MVQSSWLSVPQYKVNQKSFHAQGVVLLDIDGVPIPSGGPTSPISLKGAVPAAPVSATILLGESLSDAIDLDAERAHRIALPAAWTASAITFRSSSDGTSWNDLYTELGEYTLNSSIVGASRTIVLDQAVFYGIRHLKVRSGTSAAAVNQAAARTITVVTVPR